jgi:hypothetical protein
LVIFMRLEGTMTTNAERLALHKRRMKNAGFHRLSLWVSDELAQHLANERRQGECGGRTRERLLLGETAKRPTYPHGSMEDEKQGPRRQVSRVRV